MAEISIDQTKLPGVKEVCRDFAVLEDHTLAHSLQEQEIEHHLATNIQRNRLVQRDLRVAKQLQEEEDLKAQARIQKRHQDIERQDCEIAQEIQVKLAIEADERRRQEEKNEDIARILQQRELQEEKRRKKHFPEPTRPGSSEESYYPESGGTKSRGTKEAVYAKPRTAARDRELYDAEIARKLQEEEMLANQVDERALQVAQDEEIARLLMAEEKAAYRKAKEREKSSTEKKKLDKEWKQDGSESGRPRLREGLDSHRSKSDKLTRSLPPPPEDFDPPRSIASPPSSARHFPKLEASHKGSPYKQ
uniref:Coiled-coil domain containing 50 n=1 Tax=Sphenodon punctatus TaxID=8508 RepID=A0A8D0GTX3_SPHPU